jgi:hypothetical protein
MVSEKSNASVREIENVCTYYYADWNNFAYNESLRRKKTLILEHQQLI